MFNDKYLKFADQAEAESILYTTTPAVVVDEVETEPAQTQPNYRNMDALGVLYERPPEPVPEGYEPVALDGFHVNVRLVDGEDGSALEPYSVVPSAPRRVFWQ